MNIGLFYGSTTGCTESAAEAIQAQLNHFQAGLVTLINVGDIDHLEQMLNYDKIIIGVPTWNIGELQVDWEDVFEQFDELDLSGKQVALFGTGDQYGYPENFQDAIGIVGQKARQVGAEIVGRWTLDDYDHTASLAEEDGMFIGLALDDDNQANLSDRRIAAWVKQLLEEFGFAAEVGEPA
ncbi:MAG: flavodoxin [Anaerolineae bacterium]|nr:flavodoxin [Anaerolineae bacterium]